MKDGKRDKIRVFLIDDHPVMRDAVRSYLTSYSITVLGEAGDAKEALRKVKKLAPDVIVLDVSLPSLDGGELARRLRRIVPKCSRRSLTVQFSPVVTVQHEEFQPFRA